VNQAFVDRFWPGEDPLGRTIRSSGNELRIIGVADATGILHALDPATLVAAPLLLLAIALFAAWLPARRAARIDPVRVLKAEG
jgi:ABC-type lipoprotein release transport system permease subunit